MKVLGYEISFPQCVRNHPKRTCAAGLAAIALTLIGLGLGGKIPIGHIFSSKATCIQLGSFGAVVTGCALIWKRWYNEDKQPQINESQAPSSECRKTREWITQRSAILKNIGSQESFYGECTEGEKLIESYVPCKDAPHLVGIWRDGVETQRVVRSIFVYYVQNRMWNGDTIKIR